MPYKIDNMALARLVAVGDQKARDTMILGNRFLVIGLAKKPRWRRFLDIHDLIGYGYIGLCEAVDRFDPSRGKSFSTYAKFYIEKSFRQGIHENPAGQIVPYYVLPGHKMANSCTTEKQEKAAVALKRPHGIHEFQFSDDRDSFQDIYKNELIQFLKKKVKELPFKERKVIEYIYLSGEGRTIPSIAKEFGITKAGVHGIICRAKQRLAQKMSHLRDVI